jgi:hypothetical protein
MSERDQQQRRLESEISQAAVTPAAAHDDALSPTVTIRESLGNSGGQRVGNSGPVANPTTTFPEAEHEELFRDPDEE